MAGQSLEVPRVKLKDRGYLVKDFQISITPVSGTQTGC